MPAPRVQCPGCKKAFTPHGLSLHLSKTQDIRCQGLASVSQYSLASNFISRTAFPPPLGLTGASRSLGSELTVGQLDIQSPDGPFAARDFMNYESDLCFIRSFGM